ncbi:hypothetical protein DL93DRAFT_2232400 [Clavulina sp. PMI_390]|nr:hypothetical protein DL93DRAFT_2232400 [Clavulina sp. PMI_390]
MPSPPISSMLNSFSLLHAKLLEGFSEVFTPPTDSSSHPVSHTESVQNNFSDLASIDRTLIVVDDFTKLLAEMRALMCQVRNRTMLRNTSFGALPLELIQHIMDFAVESSRDTATIIKLSHISQWLRSALLGMNKLFVEADYRHWPATAIDEWCLRAGSSPLKIAFKAYPHSDGTNVIRKVKTNHLKKTQTIHLNVSAMKAREFTDGDLGVPAWFAQPLPLLRTLCYSDQRRNIPSPYFLRLHSSNFPSLQSLYLPDTPPSIIGPPFAQLRNLGILVWNTQTLQQFVSLIANLGSLTHLTLYAHTREVTELQGYTSSPIQTLESLLSLRLTRYSDSDIDDIHVILESFNAPRLWTLEIINCESRIVSQLAVQQRKAISNASELIVGQLTQASNDLSDIFLPLCEKQQLPYPNLHRLVIQPGDHWEEMTEDGDDPQYWPGLLALVQARKGTLKSVVIPFVLPEPHQQVMLEHSIEVTTGFELDEHGVPTDAL